MLGDEVIILNNCNSTNGERMNKLLFKAFALILLVATIFFVFGVGDVSAAEWNVTPGGSIQTAVDNAGENDTINVQGNGSEYTYHENVIVNKTGLIIQASAPITVQAANPNNPVFTINSEGSGSTIQSFRITGATGTGSTGILLEGTTNCNILYNTIEGNAEGITLIGSTFNTVYANIIQNNYGTGILLAFSPQNNLTGNSIHYNGNGISLEMSGNNILRNNDLYNYYYYSTRGYNFGVSGYAEDYIQDIDTSNTINWNPIYYLVGQSDQTLEYIYGCYLALVNCNNITVNSASMYYNDKGIVLVNTTNSTIESSSFSYNIDGIYLLDSSYNTIKDNSVYENYDLKKKEKSGIHLENSHYNTVYNNYAHNNNVGLSLIMSSGNLIYDNSVNNNFESGIYVLGSSSNTLTSNNINNNPLGLDLRGFAANNIIYNNNFNNTVQVIVESGSTGNQFNLGYPYGGNFWSNYTGINRGDGIGNIPYYFSGGQDNLPYVGHVLNVFPGDSIGETIQNLAGPGDSILVNDDHGTPYTYYENIEINKRINLRALGSVTIQASETGQPIIQIVSGGDGTLIRGFNITGSTNGVGIIIQFANNCNITGNNITNNRDGIDMGSGNGNTFTDNILSNNSAIGMSIYESSYNTLRNNTISGSEMNFYLVGWGTLSNYYHDIDTSNTADGKPIYYLRNHSGETYNRTSMGYLALIECSNMTLLNLNITHSGEGVLLVATNNSTINNCSFQDNGEGIRLEMSSSGNNLNSNNITGNSQYGIEISDSDNNTLTSNTVNNNVRGIYLTGSTGNNLSGNIITNSTLQNFSVDSESGIDGYLNTILTNNTINGDPIYYLQGLNHQTIDGNLLSIGYLALVQCNNMIIQNLNLMGNGQGIVMAGCSNITLQNSTFTDNGDGIKLYNTINSTITNNSVNGSSGTYNALSGILMNASSGNNISNNSIDNTGSGIRLQEGSNNNILTNNTATNVHWGALSISMSSENLLRNTTLTTTGGGTQITIYGTELSHYYQDIDTSNTIDGKPLYYLRNRTGETYDGVSMGYLGMVECSNMTILNIALSNVNNGILLVATNNSTIQDCSFSYNVEGIYLWNSSNNHILNNIVNNNIAEGRQSGIHLENGSNNNEIRENDVYENEAGIVILGSSGNTVSNNNVHDNWYDGIRVDQNSQNNTLHGNTCTSNGNTIYSSNGGSGIVIDTNSAGTVVSGNLIEYNGNGLSILNGSHDNTIVGNDIDDNYGWSNSDIGYGVLIKGNSHNNLIYNNNICWNNIQAYVESGCTGNLFNKPEWVGGNYWGYWNYYDLGDGFANASYVFTGGQDNLPYIQWINNVFPGESIQDYIDEVYYGGNVLVHDNLGQAYNYVENIYISAPEWYQYYNGLRIKADGDVTVTAANSALNVFSIGSNGAYTTIQGFTITGVAGSSAVFLNNVNNCKILNNKISNNTLGIVISNRGNNTINNNIIANNGAGIQIYQTQNNTINNNTFTSNDYGIYLLEGNDNIISNSLFTVTNGNGRALYLESGQGNEVINNSIVGGVYGVESLNDYRSYYEGNDISGTAWRNMYLTNPQEVVIYNNFIHDTINGMLILGGSQNQIMANTLTGCGSGLEIVNSNNNFVPRNNIMQNTFGMYIYGNSGTNIYENSVSNCGSGIELHESSLSNVYLNNLSENTFGIYVAGGTENTVEMNDILNTLYGGAGVHFENTSNSIINNNTFTSDVKDFRYGIY
ncbi:MAG: parallel beta-helix repeat (two copies), partial [Methanobacterium sp. Maddingley MBC34]